MYIYKCIYTYFHMGYIYIELDVAMRLHAGTVLCNMQHAGGCGGLRVSHIRHLFTPLSTIPKKGLSADEVSLLRHLTKQRCCKETRTSFLMVGGDNVAESLAAVTKSHLRHLGLQKVVNDPIEHRNVLAVQYVKKNLVWKVS